MTKKEALSILQPAERSDEALKAAYRKAALRNHPDHGGDEKLMKLVNIAYEMLKGAFWTPYEKRAAGRDEPLTETMRRVWDRVSGFPGISGEVCGTWLWISGETWRYKKELKEIGFRWSGKKRAWYWHNDAGYRKKSKQEWTLDGIRETFGSQKLHETTLSLT